MIISDEIILLGTTEFSEKSIVIHCLSRTWGRRSFLVRNAGKYTGFFQPLNVVSCNVTENPKSNLFCAKDFYSVLPLNGIRGSVIKNSISIFMAEVLFRALPEACEERGLYDWCREEIALLDTLDGHYSNFHVLFLLDLAAACGFRPTTEGLAPFIGDQADKMFEIMTLDRAGSMMMPMTGNQRASICERLIKYLEFHLETRINIRSLKVLQELF